jgi:hypothetical protein
LWQTLDVLNGTVGDVRDLCVMESYKSKLSQICCAGEAAEMVQFFFFNTTVIMLFFKN